MGAGRISQARCTVGSYEVACRCAESRFQRTGVYPYVRVRRSAPSRVSRAAYSDGMGVVCPLSSTPVWGATQAPPYRMRRGLWTECSRVRGYRWTLKTVHCDS